MQRCTTLPNTLLQTMYDRVSAHSANIVQRLHRLDPSSAITRRHLQQQRPKLRQPRRGYMVVRRIKRRHHLLLPPPPPSPDDQMPARRLLLSPPRHSQHTAHLPDHWQRALATPAKP